MCLGERIQNPTSHLQYIIEIEGNLIEMENLFYLVRSKKNKEDYKKNLVCVYSVKTKAERQKVFIYGTKRSEANKHIKV